VLQLSLCLLDYWAVTQDHAAAKISVKPAKSGLSRSGIASLFLDKTRDAVITVDSAGTIQGWNPAAERIYGYSPAEIAGRHFSVLFAHDVDERDAGILPEKLSGGKTITDWDTTQLHKNGSTVDTSIDIFLVLADDGAPAGNCIVAREMARSRMLQSQIRHSQKLEAMGRLSAGVAHDFNNLLTVISGYNSMIIAELSDENRLLPYATEIDKAAEKATRLTNQLLAFSRREVTQPRVLNLNELAEDLEKMLSRILGCSIQLILSLEHGLGNVKADAGQIGQLLTNLAVNARDAMPGGGTITIATETVELSGPAVADGHELAPGPYVKLTISDTGTGMDAETRNHLFEPFFTTKPRGTGTGLGLSIVFGIVSQLRGDIRVSSEPGKGTTFAIFLPVTTEPITSKGPTPAATPRKTNSPVTVLLVEDDSEILHLVRQMLLRGGYTVYETSDPREAARICETVPIHLLLTDISMPEVDGPELAARLMKIREGLVVLYMSGYLWPESVIDSSSSEAGVYFIQKPFTAGGLCRQIEAIFNPGHLKPSVDPAIV
jgi:two-component system cell cycle sensor histidine kinase/response regulator CckA